MLQTFEYLFSFSCVALLCVRKGHQLSAFSIQLLGS